MQGWPLPNDYKDLDDLEDDDEWDEATLCPPPFLVVSEKYKLVQHPITGEIGPMEPLICEEDVARFNRNLKAYNEESQVSMPEFEDTSQRLDVDPEDMTDYVDGDGSGRKRGQARVLCHYEACRQEITGTPLTCPPGTDDPEAPDLPYPFCSYASMKAWALYSIGLPLCTSMCEVIDMRAGYTVTPDIAPYEFIQGKLDAMTITPQHAPKMRCLTEANDMEIESSSDQSSHAITNVDDASSHPPLPQLQPSKLVKCRNCGSPTTINKSYPMIYMVTAAMWCFCSDHCAETSPAFAAGELMRLELFLDAQSRGQLDLFRRPTWGTEPHDGED